MNDTFEAERMKTIPFSGIRKVFEKVVELENKGEDIVKFVTGRPDFDTPVHIKNAAKQALDEGFVHYTSNYGLPKLLELISKKLEKENNLKYNPKGEIIVTVGANEAVLLTMMAFLNPGDEVLIQDPIWLHYYYCAELASAKAVPVPLNSKNDFVMDPSDIEDRVTSKTKMIVINSPHNPTGAVVEEDKLREIARIAKKHDLLIVSDEIYEHIIYDDAKHFSIGSIPDVWDRTITINGFSKSYSMTGWRLGYVAAPAKLTAVMNRVHQYTTVCANSFAQKGAIAALEGGNECVNSMVEEFKNRRKLILELMKDIPGFECGKPKGAFYVFPSIKNTGMTSFEITDYLLNEAKVAVVPGSVFGSKGEGYLRFSYAASQEDIREGLKRIKAAMEKLGGKING